MLIKNLSKKNSGILIHFPKHDIYSVSFPKQRGYFKFFTLEKYFTGFFHKHVLLTSS